MKNITITPKRVEVSPDQRSQTFTILQNGEQPRTRVRPKNIPEGFGAERISRSKFEVTWEETVREPTRVKFGIEGISGMVSATATLVPNEDELAAYDEQGDDLDGKTDQEKETTQDGA